MQIEVTLPQVAAMPQRGRFYKGDNDQDMIEISFVGSKDTVAKKVKPEHMAQFKAEWDAFCDGKPAQKRAGTALTDVMADEVAEAYIARNIHNLEEFAALSDGQCQALGHGTLTLREKSRKLIAERQMNWSDSRRKQISEAAAKLTSAPAETPDLDQVKADVAELKAGMAAILEVLQAKKGGRPKKVQEPS